MFSCLTARRLPAEARAGEIHAITRVFLSGVMIRTKTLFPHVHKKITVVTAVTFPSVRNTRAGRPEVFDLGFVIYIVGGCRL